MSDLSGVIQKISYFEELPPEELRRLTAASRVISVDAGEAVFYEGEPAAGLYYVWRGSVKVLRYSPEGRQLIVREFRPGETFNEVGALDGTENAATAIAGKKETQVILIAGDVIRDLIGRYPAVGSKMVRAMAQKLRFAMQKVNSLALMDVKARLAVHLLENADDAGVLKGISHEELAAQLGTVRQVLGRALGELQRAGAVDVKRGMIRVLDREALEALREGRGN